MQLGSLLNKLANTLVIAGILDPTPQAQLNEYYPCSNVNQPKPYSREQQSCPTNHMKAGRTHLS